MWRSIVNKAVQSRLLGVLALFSGVALLTNILAGVSLGLALGTAAILLLVAAAYLWRQASVKQRTLLARLARVGFVSGLFATISYDVTKFALSQLDPSPYNPFEATRIFGVLLVGQASGDVAVYAAGTAFHVLNGICFGVAYCILFRPGHILTGMAWGLFLEMFQLTLYPGWLNIRFLSEFTQISALSHVVYGAVLGTSCRAGLARGWNLRGGQQSG